MSASQVNKGFSLKRLFSKKSEIPTPDPDKESEAEAGLALLGAEGLRSPAPGQQLPEEPTESTWRKYLKVNLTIMAIILAIAIGCLLKLREEPYTKREVMHVGFVGSIYLRILQGLACPLLILSVMSSLGKLNMKLAGIIGVRAVIYFISTTSIAITIGIMLVFLIQPGKNFVSDEPNEKANDARFARDTTMEDTALDIIRNCFPYNLIRAMLFVDRTDLTRPEPFKYNETEGNETILVTEALPPIREWDFDVNTVRATNFLGLIFTSIVISLHLGARKPKAILLTQLIDNLNDILIVILQAVLWLTPPGVFFLVTSKIMEMKNWEVFFGQVGMYSLTVLTGLSIHVLIALPLIYTIFTRKLPFVYFFNLTEALLTAFATSSSLATLPVTLDCVERKNKIPVIVSRFVITFGATVNMDGTALYEAVAPLFIAQARNLNVPFFELLLMSLTALLASVGAAGIPQAGLVIMVIVFAIIGINPEDISYIIVVDWLLDRFRTVTNVTSDSVGAAVVYELSKKQIERLKEELSKNPIYT